MAGIDGNNNQFQIRLKGTNQQIDVSKLQGLRRTEQNKSLFDYIERQKGGKADGVLDEAEAKMLQDLLTRAAKHGADGIISQRELKKATNGNLFADLESLARQQEALEKEGHYSESTIIAGGDVTDEYITKNSYDKVVTNANGDSTYINTEGVADTIYKDGNRLIENDNEVVYSNNQTHLVTTYDKKEGFTYVDFPPDAENSQGFREVLTSDGKKAAIIKHGEIGGRTADTWTNFAPDGHVESVVIDYPYTTAIAENVRTVRTSYAQDGITETRYDTEAFVTSDNIMTGQQMQNGISIVKSYHNSTEAAQDGAQPFETRTTTMVGGNISQIVIEDDKGNIKILDGNERVVKTMKKTTDHGVTTLTSFGKIGLAESVKINDADGKPVTTMSVKVNTNDTFNDVVNNIIEQYNLPRQDDFIRDKVKKALIAENFTPDNKGLCRMMKSGPNKGNYYFLAGQSANLSVEGLNAILQDHSQKMDEAMVPVSTLATPHEPPTLDPAKIQIKPIEEPKDVVNARIDRMLEGKSQKELLNLSNGTTDINVLERIAMRLALDGKQTEARGVISRVRDIQKQQEAVAAQQLQEAKVKTQAQASGIPTFEKGQFDNNLGFSQHSQFANLGTVQLNGATLLVQANDGGKVTVHTDFGSKQFDSVKDMQAAINNNDSFFMDIGGESGGISDINTYISQNKLGAMPAPDLNADDFPANMEFKPHPAHSSFGTINVADGQSVLVKAGENGEIIAYKRDGDKLVSQKFASVEAMQAELDNSHSAGFFSSIINNNEGAIGDITKIFIANNAAEPQISKSVTTTATTATNTDGTTTVTTDADVADAATVSPQPVDPPKPKKAAWRTMGTKPHPNGKWTRASQASQNAYSTKTPVQIAEDLCKNAFGGYLDRAQINHLKDIIIAQNPSVFDRSTGQIRTDAKMEKLDIPNVEWLKEEFPNPNIVRQAGPNLNNSGSNGTPVGGGVLSNDPAPQRSLLHYQFNNAGPVMQQWGLDAEFATQVQANARQQEQDYSKAVQAGKKFMSISNTSLSPINDVNAQNIRGFLSQTQGVGSSCITKIIQCNASEADKKAAAVKLLKAAQGWGGGAINRKIIRAANGSVIDINQLIATLQSNSYVKLDTKMNEINRVFSTLQAL